MQTGSMSWISGNVVMQGNPKRSFPGGYPEKIRLDVPQVTLLAYELKNPVWMFRMEY